MGRDRYITTLNVEVDTDVDVTITYSDVKRILNNLNEEEISELKQEYFGTKSDVSIGASGGFLSLRG